MNLTAFEASTLSLLSEATHLDRVNVPELLNDLGPEARELAEEVLKRKESSMLVIQLTAKEATEVSDLLTKKGISDIVVARVVGLPKASGSFTLSLSEADTPRLDSLIEDLEEKGNKAAMQAASKIRKASR